MPGMNKLLGNRVKRIVLLYILAVLALALLILVDDVQAECGATNPGICASSEYTRSTFSDTCLIDFPLRSGTRPGRANARPFYPCLSGLVDGERSAMKSGRLHLSDRGAVP